MDNKNGGQISTPPSWNVWGQAAARNAQQAKKDSPAQQPQQLTSAQRQQQTATELARKKVLEAYKSQPQNYKTATAQETTPQIKQEDWRKYHSAWQNYYQKYYGEYYGRAAQEYVAREKMRIEREVAEKSRKEQESIFSKAAEPAPEPETTPEEVEEIQNSFRERIRKTAEKRARKNKKFYKWIPLGIGIFVLVCGVLLQYNQVIAANVVAYMSPGDNSSNTITAIDPTLTIATHDSPYLMIPKLNVEVPVVFGSANDVASMNIAMGNGVANFAVPGASAKPGEIGNFVISGHSAGNVYQNTNYKFIFSGLPRMVDGDLIYMDYEGKRYTYKMIGHTIVDPSDVNVLVRIANENPDKPLITLLTCYPLGTSRQRYVIFGEQINPSYEEAPSAAPVVDDGGDTKTSMPEGDPSPLEQLWKWLTGQQ
ncbi:class E sortase [Candidatus Saccharibacteria bacterium]|nr:class E sortase [Candidatus Saccharibacteria bacterium]